MFGRLSIPAFLACLAVASATAGFTGHEDVEIVPRSTPGEATVYSASGADGSCGTELENTEFFVALSNDLMAGESPNTQYCGKTITVTNTGASVNQNIGGVGETVTVTVRDTCPSCSTNHLDLSEAAWNQLTANSAYGYTGITWSFNS